MMRASPCGLFLVGAIFSAGGASARESAGAGVYGRFTDEARVSIEAGAAVSSPTGTSGGSSDWVGSGEAVFGLRALYLETAGLAVAAGVDGAGGWRLAALTDLRPFTLYRLFTNRFLGTAFADLLIDSAGIELGVEFAVGRDATAAAVGFVYGAAFEIPVVYGGGVGLSLRLAGQGVLYDARWTNASGRGAPPEWRAYVTIELHLPLPLRWL